jgi:hypothetical protein
MLNLPLADAVFHPATWVALLLVLRALAAHQAWLYEHGTPYPAWVERLRASSDAALLLPALYLAGPLVLAAALRVGDARDLGLVRPPLSILPLVVPAVFAFAIAAARRWFDHVTGFRRAPRRPGRDADYWGRVLLNALTLEAHWAFFRAGTLSIGLADLSLAVYLSLGLLALEAWSDPARRSDLTEPEAAVDLARGAAFALMSGLTFILTGSLAACVVVHLAAAVPLGWYGYLPLPAPAFGHPATTAEHAGIEPTVV